MDEIGRLPRRLGPRAKFPEPGRHFFGSGGHPVGLRSGDPGYTIPGAGEIFGNFPGGTIRKNFTFALETCCVTWDGKKWMKDGVKLENCGVVTDSRFEPFYRAPLKDIVVCGLPGEYCPTK